MIISLIIHRKPSFSLHNMKMNGEEYRNETESKLNLNASLKDPIGIEETLISLIDILAQAARNSTPELQPSQQNYSHVLAEIKKPVAINRRAITKWKTTHAPQD